jgi:hypothetical protein
MTVLVEAEGPGSEMRRLTRLAACFVIACVLAGQFRGPRAIVANRSATWPDPCARHRRA